MALSFNALMAAVPVVLQAGNVPNIVGEAGIGKSALVAQVAQQIHAQLFTTVVSLSEKGDLAIPIPPLTADSFIQTAHYGRIADVQYGYAHTLVTIIQFAEQHPQQQIIWFLDEFNRGTQAVQSELMNLVLQRRINDLMLPKQVSLILAENPDAQMQGFTDTFYGVTAGDDAIKDRTTRLVMTEDIHDWLTWARRLDANGQPNIMQSISDYLTQQPEDLRPVHHDQDVYPTPRAWQRVSANLRQLHQLPDAMQRKLQFDLIVGDLGTTVGAKFNQFLGAPLTVPALFDNATAVGAPSESLMQTFKTLSVAEQQSLLIAAGQWSAAPLTTDAYATRWQALLQQLPTDGQFAVVSALGQQPNWLSSLQSASSPAVRRLATVVLKIMNGQAFDA
ncbi:MAG TPA: ATPase [Lactobacillus sp.]|nr:ATPase [Lactobacillus sp.]